MAAQNRRLKTITLDIDGENFECQIKSWKMANGSDDGDHMYTFCPDGEFIEESDDQYTLELTFYADWRAGGISDYLWLHNREVVTFQLDHHPDIDGEHVRWNGSIYLKVPDAGGDVRTTEEQEASFQVIGLPVYSRP